MVRENPKSVQTDEKPTEDTSSDVVEYVGGADVRKISKRAWASVGVEDQEAVTWDASNRRRVKTSELSKSALEFLATDSGFKLPKS